MNRIKKCIVNIIVIILLCCNINVLASGLEICYDGETHWYTGEVYRLFANGKEIKADMEPIIFNDHALVPVREVFEAFGATVNYDGDARSVNIRYEDVRITLHINNNRAYVNGKAMLIPDGVVPKLIYKPGGLTKTMVPVRFISESAGMMVDFREESGEIHITGDVISTPAPTPKPTVKPTQAPVVGDVTIARIQTEMLAANNAQIIVYCSGDASSKLSHFQLTNPSRVVVDFKGIKYSGGDTTTNLGGDGIKALRTGVDSERTRIVIDVNELLDYSVEANSRFVAINVRAKGAGVVATPKPVATSAPTSTPKPVATSAPTSTPKPVATPVPTRAPKKETYEKGFTYAKGVDLNKIIMIDPGHGGADPGALGTLNGKTIKEKDLTLSISKKVRRILESYGYKTAMTRDDDSFPTLVERPQMANSQNCALFVSIHINSAVAAEAKGTEVYYSEENNDFEYWITSEEFATNVLDTMLKHMNPVNRGVKMANWAVTRRSEMPAILVEVGFISNPGELGLMASDSYQEKVAKGIAEGIINTVHYVDMP